MPFIFILYLIAQLSALRSPIEFLTPCQIELQLHLTSIFETSSPDFNYNICTVLADNHGYSAGIIQFTTSTGSARDLIAKYTAIKSPNEFTVYENELSRPSADISNLGGYCTAWASASSDEKFQTLQLQSLITSYLIPSQILAHASNLTLVVSFGQIYDSTVQLGLEATRALILALGSVQTNEITWLKSFLAARRTKLESMGPVYAATQTRIKSYESAVDHYSMFQEGSTGHALNNDGKDVELKCTGMTFPMAFSDVSGGGMDGNSGIWGNGGFEANGRGWLRMSLGALVSWIWL